VSRVVVALIADLMDRSRLIAEPGVEVRFVEPAGIGDAGGADLIVVDLGGRGHLDALAHCPAGVPVVAFGPHVDRELLAAAEAAGCDRVLPRSKFFQLWPDV